MKLLHLAALGLAGLACLTWMRHDAAAGVYPPLTLRITGTVSSVTSKSGNPGLDHLGGGGPIVLPAPGSRATFEIALRYINPLESDERYDGYIYDNMTGSESWQYDAYGSYHGTQGTVGLGSGVPPALVDGAYQYGFVGHTHPSREPYISGDTSFVFPGKELYTSDSELLQAIGGLTGSGAVTYEQALDLDHPYPPPAGPIADYEVKLTGLHAVVTPLPGGLALLLAPLAGLGVACRRRRALYPL